MITYFRLFFDTESLGILCSGHYVIQLDKEYRKRIAYICESDDETNCVTRYHVLCGFSVPKLIWKPCQKQKKKKGQRPQWLYNSSEASKYFIE